MSLFKHRSDLETINLDFAREGGIENKNKNYFIPLTYCLVNSKN